MFINEAYVGVYFESVVYSWTTAMSKFKVPFLILISREVAFTNLFVQMIVQSLFHVMA